MIVDRGLNEQLIKEVFMKQIRIMPVIAAVLIILCTMFASCNLFNLGDVIQEKLGIGKYDEARYNEAVYSD